MSDVMDKAPAKRGRKPGTMTDEHKQALAHGRDQGRVVRTYLEALEGNRPKRGRKRTPDSIKARLDSIERTLEDCDALSKVLLLSEKEHLQNELVRHEVTVEGDIAEKEEKFIEVAKDFTLRRGITYTAWKEAGVNPDVLRKAGIDR